MWGERDFKADQQDSPWVRIGGPFIGLHKISLLGFHIGMLKIQTGSSRLRLLVTWVRGSTLVERTRELDNYSVSLRNSINSIWNLGLQVSILDLPGSTSRHTHKTRSLENLGFTLFYIGFFSRT